jgi:hypothetical protein
MPMRPYDGRVTDTDETGAPDTTGVPGTTGAPDDPGAPGGPGPSDPPPVDAGPATPTSSPGERRLARPPSDRYREAEAAAAAADAEVAVDPSASVVRGVALATVVAIAGAAAIVYLGGVLLLTEVLLVVAGFTGGGVGLALRWGAAEHLAGRRRVVLALGLALGAVAVGQLGLWLHGQSIGGVLGPIDYLGQVYGPLVLVEFAAAGVVAWLAAR